MNRPNLRWVFNIVFPSWIMPATCLQTIVGVVDNVFYRDKHNLLRIKCLSGRNEALNTVIFGVNDARQRALTPCYHDRVRLILSTQFKVVEWNLSVMFVIYSTSDYGLIVKHWSVSIHTYLQTYFISTDSATLFHGCVVIVIQ